MARRRGNPVEDFINTAGAWLGGNRRIESPAVTRGREAIQQTLGALDTAAGGFGQAAVNDARRLSSGGGYVPSQTIKTAAVNLGAAAAGYGAAQVAGKVVESGVIAQAVNKVTGQQVILHGSPVKNIKQLEPLSGGRFAPNVPQRYLYGLNPEAAKTENLGKFVGEYAKKGGRGMNLKVESPGSVYVAKVSNKSVVNPEALGQGARLPIITSTGSAKVVREIPVSGLSEADLEKQILKAVKRAGAKVPKKK